MPISNSTGKMGLNSILYFMSMIFPKIIGFVLLPIYSSYILPKDYAILAYTGSFTTILAVLSTLGLNAFYLRNYSRCTDTKEFNGTVYWFMLIWNIILFTVSIPVIQYLFYVLKAPIPFYPYMFTALITQFFFSMEIIPMRTYRIKGEANNYLVMVTLKSIINAILVLFLVIKMQYGIMGKLSADIITGGVFALIFIHYMYKNSYLRINRNLIKQGLKFSLPIVPSDLLQVSTPSVKNILVEKALNMGQLGIFSIGSTIAGAAQMIVASITLAVEPELYIQAASDDYPKFAKKLKNMEMVLITWFCCGCGLFMREAIMLLLSNKYWPAWPVAQVLVISYMVSVLKDFYGQLMIIQAKTKILVWGNIGNLIVNAFICWFLVPILGIEMLGWSASAGYLIMFCIYYSIADRSKFIGMNHKRDFLVIIFTSFLLYLSRLLNDMSIVSVIATKIIAFILYSICLARIYDVNSQQIVLIIKKLKNKLIKKD
jgi:O-antigen/teichoic acid export membrane protein